jgi:molecular chaperone GrpE
MTEDKVKEPADAPPDVADPPSAVDGDVASQVDARVASEDDPPVDLAALRQERDDYYDRLLRKSAEFDNYRKRVERERREQADQAITDLLLDLLLVVDDFDRALSVDAKADTASYRKGVELIYGKLQDLLKKRGVTPIEAVGADFDPNLHEAVVHEPSPGKRDNEVIEELRKGYMIRDRLLRASLVKVAKA